MDKSGENVSSEIDDSLYRLAMLFDMATKVYHNHMKSEVKGK
jgi:hypothetical protein